MTRMCFLLVLSPIVSLDYMYDSGVIGCAQESNTFDAHNVLSDALCNQLAISTTDQFQEVVDRVDRWVDTFEALDLLPNGQ